MIEIIAVIAALCTIPNGYQPIGGLGSIDKYQLECQQWYIRCIEQQNQKDNPKQISSCILERTIK